MVEGGSSPGFAAEALQRLVILRQVFGKKLERNVATEAEVFGLIDNTHPASAQLLEDFVMGNCASDHSGPLNRGGSSYSQVNRAQNIRQFIARHVRVCVRTCNPQAR